MHVRPARIEDAAEMALLSAELGYPCSVPEFESRLALMLSKPAEEHVLVAEEEGVVGWTQVHILECLAVPRMAVIYGLIVSERLRGCGIGKRLMEAAEEWTRAQGITHMGLHSNVIRHDAHRFYERLGYVEKKQQKVFAKQLIQ